MTRVHVVGTGTIGLPLTALLADYRRQLGIDEVTFRKNRPTIENRAEIKALIARGALLAIDWSKLTEFQDLGFKPSLKDWDAAMQADVIIDCTPYGNEHKPAYLTDAHKNVRLFIAQGSEDGFGKKYAWGVNDEALVEGEDRFLQVVSCNTHAISSLLKTLGFDEDGKSVLDEADFTMLRRANDVSQTDGMVASLAIGRHDDEIYGTHHARDAAEVFKTLGYNLRLFSSAIKVSTQYMHTMRFRLRLGEVTTLDEVRDKLESNPAIAMTYKNQANEVFSFGRDHGRYGRLLNQVVVPYEGLAVHGGRDIVGSSFTPQDGNSLLSSIAATLWAIQPETVPEKMKVFDRYVFREV